MAPPARIAFAPNAGGQVDLIRCPSGIEEALIHGNRGGGKSLALLMVFLRGVGKGWGRAWKGVYFRRNYTRLRSVIDESLIWIPKIFPRARYVGSDKVWLFPGGERLYFRYLDRPTHYAEYHGHQYSVILFDELTEWSDGGVLSAMKGNIRSTHPSIRPIIRAATNAWGPGFSWVKEYFRIRRDTDRQPFRGKDGGLRVAILGNRSENLPLMQNDARYDYRMRHHEDPMLRIAWGSDWGWDAPMGGYMHGVMALAEVHGGVRTPPKIKPFRVPTQWPIYRLMDFGTAAPFAVLWIAVADGESPAEIPRHGAEPYLWTPPKGSRIAIHEWDGTSKEDGGKTNHGLGLGPVAIARGILEREWKWGIHNLVLPGPADGIWGGSNPNPEQETIAAVMRSVASPFADDPRVGVAFVPPVKGPDSRKAGAILLRNGLLETHSDNPVHPAMWIAEECPALWRDLLAIGRDKHDPDKMHTGGRDHLPDVARYAWLWNPGGGCSELDLGAVDWSGIGPQINFGF